MAGSTAPAQLRIGVVLEAFLDRPLEDVLAWLAQAAPEITDIEVGAGGYAPHPHCDVAELLHSAQARTAWLDLIARHGLRLDALNAWGNPLHPDEDLARRHDEDLRNAIRLAVPRDQVQPRGARLRAAQQFRHVAVRVRGIPAGPDLDVGDLRRGLRQPRQHVSQRPVEEGLEHDAYPQLRGCGGTGHRR